MSKGNKEEQKWLLGESLNQYDRSLKEELNKVEKRNREQNHKISALINAFDDDYIKKEEENTNISLDYSKEGIVIVDDIKGNTLVNNVKDSNKELVLNGDIDTSGYGNVTLTEGVDGGKVDIALEGNTMVNVCDQEDPIAITKNYEVTTGNHIALQGEYDGKCRPNIYGNTLVSWQGSKDINKGQQVTINKQYETKSIHTLHTTVGDKVYFRIKFTVDEMNTTSAEPKIFTGYSMGYKVNVKAFKDCTVGKIEEASTIREHESARTDQTHMDLCIGMYAPMPDDVPAGSAVCKYTMHDYVIYNLTQLFGAGKEPAQEWCDKNLPYLEGMQSSFEDKLITDEKDAHNGKYKVDYKVTGKNKFNGVWNKVANSKQHKSSYIKVNPNSEYILSVSNNYNDVEAEKRFNVNLYDKDKKYINFLITGYLPNNVKINTSSNCEYIQIITRVNNDFAGEYTNIEECNVQIEEGTKTTTYEPYKEYTKTLYLNTPLLEGDTIEQSGNDIVHVHRYGKVVLDGSNYSISRGGTYDSTKYRWILYKNNNILKNTNNANILINDRYPLSTPNGTWGTNNNYIEGITINSQDSSILLYLDKYKDGSADSKASLIAELQQNPLTVVYKLTTPTREVISTDDNLLLDSYVNGHLDVDSVIPIDKVVFQSYGTSLKYLSPNTEYTIQFESDSNGKLDALALNSSDVIGNLNIVKGINKFNITTSDKITINYLWTTGIGFNMSKVVVTPKVDGDFGYFKGMKSVGQNDVDGHKIEILSQNKNLIDINRFKVNGSDRGTMSIDEDILTFNYTGSYATIRQIFTQEEINLLKGKTFKFGHSGITDTVENNNLNIRFVVRVNGKYIYSPFPYNENYTRTVTLPNNIQSLEFSIVPNNTNNSNIQGTFTISKPQLVFADTENTNYVKYSSNKKEILMNEPLRGLPNGTKDKYVIIDGKWYIERNCGYVTFDGSDDEGWSDNGNIENTYFKYIYNSKTDAKKKVLTSICDKLPTISTSRLQTSIIENTSTGKIQIGCTLSTTAQFIQWLQQNPITVVYELATPTYEPIDYNPFEVYSDITHISNNSTIPCNMVIKNNGYNCILKPSTLYTIAVDTNKSGTIGMNLGGVEGTTSNNVTTITTPATLTNNTLRLYGKSIKASGVRLLEGGKTNWIPSHFEGMKSCFEDKLQEDGKYKMEILSNNENLLDLSQHSINTPYSKDYKIENNTIFSTFIGDKYTDFQLWFKLKRNETYKLSWDESSTYSLWDKCQLLKGKLSGYNANSVVQNSFSNYNGTSVIIRNLSYDGWYTLHFHSMKNNQFIKNLQLKLVDISTNFVENKHNKIQFLLNEPLRGVGDSKDRLCIKDGKLMVQRNCGSVTFDGSDTWNLNKIENNIYTYSIRSTKFLTKMKVGTWETLMNNKCYIIDKCGTATTSTPKNEQLLIHNTVEDKFIWYSTPLFSTVQSVKQYLNDNPFKILYQLETPVYEEIEYSNNRLTLDSYNNSTLFYDSNIPVSNTSFKPLWEELVYVKNSTTYYIQFNAIGNGDVVVNLGGTELSATITEGYNKIEITTPNESTNLLTIDGQGIKISKVVVSEALCSGYYKGLQSCFEEHMENGKYVCVIRGISLDGSKVNGIKFYLNEPLRGIGDIKDKLCIKDNKLMVERNFIQVIIDGENLQNYNNFAYRTLFDFKCNVLHNWELANFITDSKFSNAFIDYQWNHRDFESIAVSPLDEKTCIDIIDKSISFSIDSYKNILKEKPIKVVYQLLEPIYEEITNEYGLPIILEGYENGIVYVDSAVTPTTSIKYTSNNTVPTTLSNVDNLNTTTQDDINNNIVTYMMDIDMMLTEMEMEDNASTMSLNDSDDNNQKHNTSHNNILDRMNKEDRIKYQDNTTKMLEKVIKGKSLTNEENINRIDLYLSEGKIREEQSNYLKELLKEGE